MAESQHAKGSLSSSHISQDSSPVVGSMLWGFHGVQHRVSCTLIGTGICEVKEWKKTFPSDTTYEGLTSKIYKQLIQLNNKKNQTTLSKNGQKN